MPQRSSSEKMAFSQLKALIFVQVSKKRASKKNAILLEHVNWLNVYNLTQWAGLCYNNDYPIQLIFTPLNSAFLLTYETRLNKNRVYIK